MAEAEKLLNSMSLKQKIGQMICVRAFGYKETIEKMLAEGTAAALGAVVITQKGARDMEGVTGELNKYIKASKFPLLLYLDAEYGITDMFDFGTPFPSPMALGATFSKTLAYKMGNIIGKEARALGFSIVCSPALDINNNPDNPIINIRAISDNPDLVIELGGGYIKGMQDAGIIPTGKHFPGHGDTSVDSHVAMPLVEHGKEYLMNMELKPYRELIKRGMQGVMTAHILYPSLLAENEERVPVTLSRNIVTNLLRQELGFQGLIVSDSLAMKGIKDLYGLERSAVLAVKAGHDIILQDYSTDPELTFNAVVSAVESGEIEEEQINHSVRRILEIREKMGTLEDRVTDINAVRQIAGSKEHIAAAREIADKSVTLLEARDIPFRINEEEKLLVIATKSGEEGKTTEDLHSNIVSSASYLYGQCRRFSKNTAFFAIGENPGEGEKERLRKLSKNYDYILYAAFVRVISYKEGSGTIPPSQAEMINYLNGLDRKTAFILLGSPYPVRTLQRLNNCILTYSDCRYSIDAALKVLAGGMKAGGRLPVTLNGKYIFGYGL